MRVFLILAASLFFFAGLSSAQTRAAFSAEALIANAPAYVASRYAANELPSALIADLAAAGFECQHSAVGSECTRVREAGGSCFDVATVSIGADRVTAEENRRCMGAEE
ncbi:MAG: hypothetical protein JNL81_14205 [Hyphomonadaceae bacterium]|nr:hypothetical protein [Hyphomonadaceae bacterium]